MTDKGRGEERLPHLETFRRAAELGSFTAVARELGITQAAVSQRIHQLEQHLQVALFQRHAGRLQLTEAGAKLYDYATRLYRLQEEALAKITGHPPSPAGELVLGASTIPCEYLLADLLRSFQERYPQIRVRVQVGNTQQILRLVERGQVQLGLVGARSENPQLKCRSFATDRLVLAVAPNHSWATRKTVSLHELLDQRLIIREPGSGSRRCWEQALRRAGMTLDNWPNLMELGSNLAILEAVQRNLGVGVLSEYAARDWLALGRVAVVRLQRCRTSRRFYAVWRHRKPLPLPAQLFLNLLFPSRRYKRSTSQANAG